MFERPLFEIDEDGLVVVELLMIRWEEVDFVVVLSRRGGKEVEVMRC
jgi:hypothetical protein